MTENHIAIRVEGLGKQYKIGERQASYRTIREAIVDGAKAPFRKTASLFRGEAYGASGLREEIWALRDISFEVKKGEVLGIISRNGAGKTTLLKILSRITEPTEGSAVINGRVGSLLEVGTGMHQELTGKENVFLNGAILGMKRTEISRQFNKIVEFAGVERFIDTPMKHYSSGMQVRLAFAIAAHLEPEILMIDEVLAVGDVEFQKKCLGKMSEVVGGGRTILFVSHNLQAVRSLCPTSLLLADGRVATLSESSETISQYLADTRMSAQRVWDDGTAPGDENIRLKAIQVRNKEGGQAMSFLSDDQILIEMEVEVSDAPSSLCIGFDLGTKLGEIVLRSFHNDGRPEDWPTISKGRNLLTCSLPREFLNTGSYSISPRIVLHNNKWIVKSDPVVWFDVELSHGRSPFWNSLSAGGRPGATSPILQWKRT